MFLQKSTETLFIHKCFCICYIFEQPGEVKFDTAINIIIALRVQHSQGLLPSVRGLMQHIRMGFGKTNTVVEYYAQQFENMTVNIISLVE